MKIAICVLTIIILVLYRKICRLQNKLQSQMKNYQKIIDDKIKESRKKSMRRNECTLKWFLSHKKSRS